MNVSIMLYVNDNDIVHEAFYFELYVGNEVIPYITNNATESGIIYPASIPLAI